MTDIPAYNEKEISMKDISSRYKSDRRGSNPRSRPWQGNDKSISIVFPCFYVYFIVSISIIYLYFM